MFIIGLTGGIASGKTAASDFFKALGVTVIDADEVSREVVKPGSSALKSIQERFGDAVFDGTQLNRALLRELIFANPSEKEWLNNLLHPAIRERMHILTKQAKSEYAVWAVPLLIENKLYSLVDKVLVIDIPETLQIKRAMSRDNCSEETIRSIMSAQVGREQRNKFADYIVTNDDTLDSMKAQLSRLHDEFLKLARLKH